MSIILLAAEGGEGYGTRCMLREVKDMGQQYNNNRRLVTLAEHTSDHGKQTNSSTKEKWEHG